MNAPTSIASAVSDPMSIASRRTSTAPNAFGSARRMPAFSIEWAAGFLDGEGCIHIARQTYRGKRRDTFRLRVYIVQNNREVLEHFRDGVGIDARLYKVRRTTQHNKQVYTLNFEGKKAMALIALLMPHLIRKREEAQAAWAYWFDGKVGMRPGPKGLPPEIAALRERLYFKLRSLK